MRKAKIEEIRRKAFAEVQNAIDDLLEEHFFTRMGDTFIVCEKTACEIGDRLKALSGSYIPVPVEEADDVIKLSHDVGIALLSTLSPPGSAARSDLKDLFDIDLDEEEKKIGVPDVHGEQVDNEL